MKIRYLGTASRTPQASKVVLRLIILLALLILEFLIFWPTQLVWQQLGLPFHAGGDSSAIKAQDLVKENMACISLDPLPDTMFVGA